MSKLRQELRTGSSKPCMSNGTAYLMIYKAVETQNGLVHGKLHDHGAHCAIGSYFTVNDQTSLPETLIDEIAAVNDSVPQSSARQRKLYVMRWLRWKLASLNMTGFKAKA